MRRLRLRTTAAVAASALAVAALAGCSITVQTGPGKASPSTVPSPSAGTPSAGSEISHDDAARIATEKYGGTVKSVEDDHHDGEPTWEVELRDTSQGRIEVEVSKATGEIVNVERDD